MSAINQEKHIEDVKSLQITLLPIMMEEWHINGTELQELLSKYDLLKYIEVCYDYYNSMGIHGVLDDLSEYIKLQGGKIKWYYITDL